MLTTSHHFQDDPGIQGVDKHIDIGISFELTAEHFALMFNNPPEDQKTSIASSTVFSSKNFMIWRAIVALYFWYVLIASYIIYSYRTSFYLTIWTLECCTIYISLSLYCSYLYHSSQIEKCKKVCQITRVVQVVATTVSISVVIVFWSVYGKFIDIGGPLALPVQTHGTTAAFTIFDYFLCYSTLSFKKTWWYLVVSSIVYALWSLGYTLSTKHALYSILDWNASPIASVISVVGVTVVFLVIHLILCWSKSLLVNWLESKLSVEEETKDNADIETVTMDNKENTPKIADLPSAVSEPSITPPPETVDQETV